MSEEISYYQTEPKKKPGQAIEQQLTSIEGYIAIDPDNIDKKSLQFRIDTLAQDIDDALADADTEVAAIPDHVFMFIVGSIFLALISSSAYVWATLSIESSTAALFNRFIVNGQLNLEALAAAQRLGEVTMAQAKDIMDYASMVGQNNLSGEIVRISQLFQEGPTNILEWAGVNAPMFAVGIISLLFIALASYSAYVWNTRKMLQEQQGRLGRLSSELDGEEIAIKNGNESRFSKDLLQAYILQGIIGQELYNPYLEYRLPDDQDKEAFYPRLSDEEASEADPSDAQEAYFENEDVAASNSASI